MTIEQAQYMDMLLRRGKDNLNASGISRDIIEMLEEKMLIEVISWRNGVHPHIIETTAKGRAFLANGGFEGDVYARIRQEQDRKERKKKERKERTKEILLLLLEVAGVVIALCALL